MIDGDDKMTDLKQLGEKAVAAKYILQDLTGIQQPMKMLIVMIC